MIMLFNLCDCIQSSSLAPDMAALCSGGAGFVTAMMATLTAKGRTEPAKALRGDVPEVDKLAARMVTDNVVLQFVPHLTEVTLTQEIPDHPNGPAVHVSGAPPSIASSSRATNLVRAVDQSEYCLCSKTGSAPEPPPRCDFAHFTHDGSRQKPPMK
jgi:hypothetical protein